MRRGQKVAVVSHCLLNANVKVHGIATYAGLHPEALRLIAEGSGFVQLPCPETTFLGLKRWGMTREQYDTAAYRRHCRELLTPILDTLEELLRDGCAVEIVGAEGSPSCGISTTCVGWCGGEPDEGVGPAELAAGRGVFMEEFAGLLGSRGLDIPFRGVDESPSTTPGTHGSDEP